MHISKVPLLQFKMLNKHKRTHIHVHNVAYIKIETVKKCYKFNKWLTHNVQWNSVITI